MRKSNKKIIHKKEKEALNMCLKSRKDCELAVGAEVNLLLVPAIKKFNWKVGGGCDLVD